MRTTLVIFAALLILGLGGAALLARADAPRADDMPPRVDSVGDPLSDGAFSRLGSLRWRHPSPVVYVEYTPTAREIVSLCQDGSIYVWEAVTGKALRHFGKIGSPPGPPLIRAGGPEMLAPMANYRFVGAALAPDGKSLAVANHDGSVIVWDVATGKERKTLKAGKTLTGNVLSFAPDGKSVFARGADYVIYQLSLADGTEVRKFGEPRDFNKRIYPILGSGSLSVSEDGKTVFAGFNDRSNVPQNLPLLKSWDIESGKELPLIQGPPLPGLFRCLAISADGKRVAWGHTTGSIHVWDIASGKETATLVGPQSQFPDALCFSPDGRSLAVRNSADHSLRLWGVVEGKERRMLAGPQINESEMRNSVASNLAFSADGKRLLTGTATHTIRQLELGTGDEIGTPVPLGHRGPVTRLALSSDGKTAATYGTDRTLRCWDVALGKETQNMSVPVATAFAGFSADGKIMVTLALDGTFTVWDTATAKERYTWKDPAAANRAYASFSVSPDGKLVATRGYDSTIRLWDAANGRERPSIPGVLSDGGTAQEKARELAYAFQFATNAPVFSPDGTQLAAVAVELAGNGGSVSTLRLWDVATGMPIRKFEALKDNVHIVGFALAADSRTIGSSNSDGTVSLWESASGKERCRITFKHISGNAAPPDNDFLPKAIYASIPRVRRLPTSIVFAPGCKLIAVTGQTEDVGLWDLATGKELPPLKGHVGPVVSLAFAGNGKFLATGSNDTTALVWETPAPEPAPALQMEANQVEGLCEELANRDAAKAYQAIRVLSQLPKQAVSPLKERVQAVPVPDPQKVVQLITDLDSNVFVTRKKAEDELEKMGELAEDALRKALEGKPALELQKRLETLLAKLVTGAAPHPTQLRTLRALEVLEALGTPEAIDVLQTVARGAAGARATKDAQAALNRLGKR